MIRAFLPPLTIALTVVAAGALVLVAAAIAPPPLTAGVSSPVSSVNDPLTRHLDAGTTPLAQATFTLPPRSPAVVDLARLIYVPGTGGRSHTLSGPLLLTIESGILTAQLDGAGQILRPNLPIRTATGRLVLHARESLLLPMAMPATFTNSGSEPVVAVAAGIFPSGVVGKTFGRVGLARWADAWSPGATVQPLAGGWIVATSPVSATVTLQRVSVPPGDQLPLAAPGPLVLAVESGALALEVQDGPVWQQPPIGANTSLAPGSVGAFLPGDAALLQDEASVTLRNAGSGPVLALVVSVELIPQTAPLVGAPLAEYDGQGAASMPMNRPGAS